MLTKRRDLKEIVTKLREIDHDVGIVNENVDLFFSGDAKKSIADGNARSRVILREYESALVLQEQMGFNVVQRNREKREAIADGVIFTVPLVWWVRLPVHEREKMIWCGKADATAKIPIPPKEALDAIKEHGPLFDGLQMWWVPNDVNYRILPEPDPIIVGEKDVPGGPLFFELYRWIDGTVEDPYWNAIAY